MKTVNILLASGDRRTNNIVQTLILDVCYNRAAVNCVQTARVDVLLARGSREGFDLVLVSPDHVVAEPSRRSTAISTVEVARVVSSIKQQRSVPVIAVDVSAEDESLLSEGGADSVLRCPFNGDALRAEVHRLLHLPAPTSEAEPARGSLAGLILRSLHLLKSA